MQTRSWRTIAHTEFRSLWRDGRFRLGALVLAGTTTLSILAGAREVQRDAADRESARQAILTRWREQGDKNPHDAGHTGMIAFKPVSALAFVDRGSDFVTGVAVPLQAHSPGEPQFAPAQDASPLNRFGDLFAARVLQYLLPLLVIAFSFATIAAEREQGTLRLLLSTGVTPGSLLWGKVAGIVAAFGLLLGPIALVGAVLFLASGAATDAWLRLGTLVALYIGYLFVSLAISVGVSARATSARQALLTLLVLWAVSTVVTPSLAATAVSATATPTARAILHAVTRKALMEGINGHDPLEARAKAFTDSVLKAYRAQAVADLPVNIDGLLMQADEEYAARIYDREYRVLYDAWERQGRFQLAGTVLSPTLAVARLSAAATGTDLRHFRDFMSAAERYRQGLMRELNVDRTTHSRSGDWSYKASSTLWDRTGIPFEYSQRTLSAALFDQRIAVAAALGWLLFGCVFLARSARHIGTAA